MNDRKLAIVMFACNDPDNGNFRGHADAFDFDCPGIGELSIRSRWADWRGMVVREKYGRMRFGRHTYRHYGYREWVGNWCWNAVSLLPSDAARLLHRLRNSGNFDIEMGADEAWEVWKSGRLFESLLPAEHSPP